MGFYSGRDYTSLMLEAEGLEDGVVVDMDDGYSQDLKTIEDNVEPYNAEDVAAAQTGHPNDDEGFDPVEESWNVVYESQYNMNQIMKAIAMNECNAAYAGVLTESWDDVKGFFQRVKEAFIRLVKKVAAIVKKWIDNATTTFRSNKSFWTKYGGKLGQGLTAIQADTGKKKMKGYKFPASIVNNGLNMNGADKALKTSISTTFHVNFTNGTMDESHYGDETSGKDYSSKMSKIYAELAAAFSSGSRFSVGSDISSMDEFRKACKKAFYGGDEKEEYWMSVEQIKAILDKPDKCIKNAKDSYKKFEKSINGTISALKRLESSASKNYKSDEKDPIGSNASQTKKLNIIRQGINACQDGSNAMQVCQSVWLSAMRTYAYQARAYGNAYVYALNKKSTKGKIDKIYGREAKDEGALLAGVELI